MDESGMNLTILAIRLGPQNHESEAPTSTAERLKPIEPAERLKPIRPTTNDFKGRK